MSAKTISVRKSGSKAARKSVSKRMRALKSPQVKPQASKHNGSGAPQTPIGYVRAIKAALAQGAYLQARELSAQGAKRFPEHGQLKKYAVVLAPPRVLGSEPATKTDLRSNRDWLYQHADAYRGKWIALRDAELRGVADSLQELYSQVGTRDVFVTKVF